MTDTEIFLNQIKNTIALNTDGSLSMERAIIAYKKLREQFHKLERKYVGENTRGFIKGLLYHHNIVNSATLTALFRAREDVVEPIAYAGDTILLNAIPAFLKKSLDNQDREKLIQVRLGEQSGHPFSLYATCIDMGSETIITATVTSTPLYSTVEFDLLSELLRLLYQKKRKFYSPVTLNYSDDISAETSRLFNSGKDGPIYIDHFILYNQPGAFIGAGIYNLIDFSHFIVKTLKMTYPSDVHIFALSLNNYFVLYDENTKMGLDIKLNRIDFDYHGNNIPYKVIHNEIETQQQLYLFLESF